MTYEVIARAGRARRTRRIRMLLLALAVALLVTCVCAAVVHPGPRRRSSTSPATSYAAAPAPATSVGAQPHVGTSAPLPGDLSVAHIAGIDVPASVQDGPHRTSDGLASGFSHDRAGAVLAAANLLPRVTPQIGPAVFRPTLRNQVTGPNAAALAGQIKAQYQQMCAAAGAAPGGPVGQLTASFAGYRIDLYSDSTALLSLMSVVTRPGQPPLYVAAVVQLAWARGDWRLVAPAGGVWTQSVSQVTETQVATFNPFTAGR